MKVSYKAVLAALIFFGAGFTAAMLLVKTLLHEDEEPLVHHDLVLPFSYYHASDQPVDFPLKNTPDSLKLVRTLQDDIGIETRYFFEVTGIQAMSEIRKQFEEEGWNLEYSDKESYTGYPGQDFDAIMRKFPQILSDRYSNEETGQATIFYMFSGKATPPIVSKTYGPLKPNYTTISRSIDSLDRIEIEVVSNNDDGTSVEYFFIPNESHMIVHPLGTQ